MKDLKSFSVWVPTLQEALWGAATGLLVAGPIGAIIGGAAGTVLKKLGDDYAVRFLSPNEKERIGRVFIRTMEKIEEILKKGMKLREDDFFKEKPGERSSAKEITEGITCGSERIRRKKDNILWQSTG